METRIIRDIGFVLISLLLLAEAGPPNYAAGATHAGLPNVDRSPAADQPVAGFLGSAPQEHRDQLRISSEVKPSPAARRAGNLCRQEVGEARRPEVQGLDRLVLKNATLHGVDQKLVWAVMRQESGFNPQAVSPKGAVGLMQLMPGTAVLMGVTDPFDVEQNIAGGVKYLSLCLSRFNGDVCLALAAYNAGPENVEKYQKCPPFPETQNYVAAVLRDYSGKSPQKGWRFAARNTSKTDEEISTPPEPSGLQWKVPTPKCKLGKPEINIQAPRWKGKGLLSLPCPTRLLLVSLTAPRRIIDQK
jgi:hypothetical protein